MSQLVNKPFNICDTEVSMLNDLINWTSTYSTMSDIPVQFGGYTPHQDAFKANILEPHQISGNSSRKDT